MSKPAFTVDGTNYSEYINWLALHSSEYGECAKFILSNRRPTFVPAIFQEVIRDIDGLIITESAEEFEARKASHPETAKAEALEQSKLHARQKISFTSFIASHAGPNLGSSIRGKPGYREWIRLGDYQMLLKAIRDQCGASALNPALATTNRTFATLRQADDNAWWPDFIEKWSNAIKTLEDNGEDPNNGSLMITLRCNGQDGNGYPNRRVEKARQDRLFKLTRRMLYLVGCCRIINNSQA